MSEMRLSFKSATLNKATPFIKRVSPLKGFKRHLNMLIIIAGMAISIPTGFTAPKLIQSNASKQTVGVDVEKTAEPVNEIGTPITISGVTTEFIENIEVHLGVEDNILPYSAFGFPRSNEYIIRKTKLAMNAMGYYHPTIAVSGDHTHWKVLVEKGESIKWNETSIHLLGDGNNYPEFKKLLEQHPFPKGQTLNHGTYTQYKSKLESLALEFGMYDAEFIESQLSINLEEKTADVKWRFDSGTQYIIDKVKITGTELSPEFLSRFIFVKSNDKYLNTNIIKTQQALNRSNYFNSANIEQRLDQEEKTASITLFLRDIEKYELKTSIGYGTDSGGKLGLNWQDRRVNDFGHNYSASLDLSEIETSTAFQYKIPLEGRNNEWLNRASYRLRDDELASSKLSTLETRMLRQHTDYWSSQWAMTFATEEITANENIESYLTYVIPSMQLNYYSVTDPFSANAGWRWQQEFRFSHASLSDPNIDFFQVEQKLKKIWLISDKWRLILKGQLAFTSMDQDEFNRLMPTNYRYFAGGDVSVRGYDYQTLSPKDLNGSVLGGKHLMTNTIELDWMFADDFRWALFTDQGNAFNDWSDRQLKKSFGTGLRWVTPVGSIRFDIAKALDEQKEWRWHITIGPDL